MVADDPLEFYTLCHLASFVLESMSTDRSSHRTTSGHGR